MPASTVVGDIFEEIKKLRNTPEYVPCSIDGEQNDVPGHFSRIYSKLYNSAGDRKELDERKDIIENKITKSNISDVNKVTPSIVKEATKNLKNGKSDPVFDFDSDCLKNAPDELFMHLSTLIKMFLIHGHVTSYLLLATLVPIIKDKLGDSCSSKNYRSITISSLVLKILDWVILLLHGACLGLDDLQFAYQPGVSTTMCSWAVIETAAYAICQKPLTLLCIQCSSTS